MNKKIIHYAFKYLYCYPFYLYGLWRISHLNKPIVTIFGGKHAVQNDFYYQQSFQLAQRLVQEDFSVLTGGGPGIMESVLCGALTQNKKHAILGIDVVGIDENFFSACPYQKIYMRDFATRKKLLIQFSSAFICFPGGIGTLNEISEVLNLIKTKKLDHVPIILIGKEYWNFFTKWFEHALEKKFIAPQFGNLFVVTDDIERALSVLANKKKE